MKELSKAYEPKQYEDEIYKRWEESGFFAPEAHPLWVDNPDDPNRPSFSIVLPPPNVTGTLHMGHAVMLAVEDAMIRYHRMKGDRTLWVPGTDHAAIATQEKVEKILWNEEKKTRHDLGRDVFLNRVEKFAQESHDTIVNQCRKMGASLDWSREAYTLDEKRNYAVRYAFKQMYDEGLIYRGDRIVNWDPKMQSTVSDIEVDRIETKTKFYYFQYGPFVISTARPETKFGDKYVVMHPDDERYAQYKDGDTFECEWINGKITATIIKDAAVDPLFGTGVMTITPWHDATDFFMAERHSLDKEQVIDLKGNLLPIAGEFAGMPIAEARPKIVEKLQAKGLVVKIDEEYIQQKAVNSRGGGVIEPQIMRQWWVDVNKEFVLKESHIDGIMSGQKVTLKFLMQHVVRSGAIKILPEQFEKVYFHWIDNLLDWCLSRQLWFGHRIPAWYKGDGVYVGVDAPEGEGWTQDSDTLDTWFSAGLWTFSTLGWPEETSDLKMYHPTNVLETGYDILFFWVAKMILMSAYHLGDIPFKTVYLHGLVRDEKGRKMSKSLDNIINPLDMIAKYGTDATRLSLLIGNTPGNDMKLSEEKVAGFRNFTNKLWNISRFILTQKDDGQSPMTMADFWILGRMMHVNGIVSESMETYQFSAAGEALRDFTWNDLADWYLEIAKIEGNKSVTLKFILDFILKLWHPFMPFVTEAVWQEMYDGKRMLMVEKLIFSEELLQAAPQETIVKREETAFLDFEIVRKVVTGIRSLRADYKIEPGKKLVAFVSVGNMTDILQENKAIILGLARLETVTIENKIEKPATAVGFVVGGVEVFVDLAGVVDVAKEKVRLQKEIGEVEPYVVSLEKKLGNDGFVSNASPEVVEKERTKLADAKEKVEKLRAQLSILNP